MEGVYDHIQEEALSPDTEKPPTKETDGNLGNDLQETYRTFAASPWGTSIGNFLGTVRKQGESYITEARNEATAAGGEALKGFTELRSSLINHARTLSGGSGPAGAADGPTSGEAAAPAETSEQSDKSVEKDAPDAAPRSASEAKADADGLLSRFRAEAGKRLKDIQRAEDAADEALLRFGTNIRNFLKDAVTVAPPAEGEGEQAEKVLFESKDAEGRKVIHTSRFDAQLHVIHCALESFTRDPASPEWEKWKSEFDAEQKTDAIATDLKRYDELWRAMEKLVPEQVDYETFWCRYYFLRLVIESEEQRRKDMLKVAALNNEEVAWDEDSDSDADNARTTPQASSTANLSPPDAKEPRKSQDQASTAGSDASYDIVSGAQSRATGSPREEKTVRLGKVDEKTDADSDDDWE